MGRLIGTKNRTYSEIDKEMILLEHYNDHISWKELCRKYNLSSSLIYDWDIKYKSKGIDGLKQVLNKIKEEQVETPIILHTDQGTVYSSQAYNNLLNDFNIHVQ